MAVSADESLARDLRQDLVIAEERQVLAFVVQRRIEERTDDNLAELALLFGRDETAEVEEPRATRPRVGAAPDGIPLAVVGAVDVPRGFEPRLAVGELDALPLPQPREPSAPRST